MNKTLTRITNSALLSGLLVGLAPAALAGQISQTTVLNSTNFFDTISFNLFNPLLGTLTGVTLDASASITVYDEDSSNLCTSIQDCDGDITLQGEGTGGLSSFLDSDAAFVSNQEVDQGVFVNLSYSALGVSFGNLGDFTAPGANPGIQNSVFLVPAGSGTFTSFQFSNEAGSVTLTYDFEDGASVPEPSILGLLGLGLLGLGMTRSRRSRQG